jgi:hypothetical protein|tara:strand:- start:40 stop:285 length:246 start_codon:yes stop_codon:yes gene_type:complete
MINYKVLKAASKVSIAKTNEDKYFITKKNYNVDTGEAKDDSISQVRIEEIDTRVSRISASITSLTSEKADYEQLKTDLEAL